MSESLFQRLLNRRRAITAGDPTGAATGPNTAQVRAETAPASAPRPVAQGAKSGAAAALTRRPNETASSFRLRQIEAAKAAGEL